MSAKHAARAAILVATAAAALAAAAPASAKTSRPGAKTYTVSGRQTAIDADAGTYRMAGRLVGMWRTLSSETTAESPLYEAKGTERFRGCLDRGRDGSCAGDPSGTLTFRFLLWAKNDPNDPSSLIWGACWHPIVEGTGDFAGADGVLTFVDTQRHDGVRTAYIGNVTIPRA
jgi:hypothetical protein